MFACARGIAVVVGVLSGLHAISLPAWGQPAPPEPQQQIVVKDLFTDGEKIILVAEVAGPLPKEGQPPETLNLSLEDFAIAREFCEGLLVAREKTLGKDHWRVTDARLALEQMQLLEKPRPPSARNLAGWPS